MEVSAEGWEVTEGGIFTLMVTEELLAVQAPLLMVHWKILSPGVSPDTVELYFSSSVTVPVPPTLVQAPVPIEGLFADKVVVVTLSHKVLPLPAFEVVGAAST
jgi:hypothetical protein